MFIYWNDENSDKFEIREKNLVETTDIMHKPNTKFNIFNNFLALFAFIDHEAKCPQNVAIISSVTATKTLIAKITITCNLNCSIISLWNVIDLMRKITYYNSILVLVSSEVIDSALMQLLTAN